MTADLRVVERREKLEHVGPCVDVIGQVVQQGGVLVEVVRHLVQQHLFKTAAIQFANDGLVVARVGKDFETLAPTKPQPMPQVCGTKAMVSRPPPSGFPSMSSL